MQRHNSADRVLFIIPPYVDFNNFTNPSFNERVVTKNGRAFASVVTDMPIGVISLSAYIKKHLTIEVELLDFNIILNKLHDFDYRSFSELYSRELASSKIHNFQPTIIAISTLFTTAYYNMIDIANIAKEIFPSAIVIAGGGVPTNMYRDIFRDCDSIDGICFGEGELPLLNLLKSNQKIDFMNKNPSWITRKKAEQNGEFLHEAIEDLDEIPFYDYGLLEINAYGISPTASNYATFSDATTIFHIATSRGCPHRCCFCASHTVHGRVQRFHSIARVKDDLERLYKEFGATKIGFQDDHIMGDKKRALEIIQITQNIGLVIFFQSGLALYALDRHVLETLKAAGIHHLVLAIESGSHRVLREIMHKPINLNIVRRVVNDCRELGIETDANILIGLPGETLNDIDDTRLFLKSIDANWFRIYIATPLVGSELFDLCNINGYIAGSHIGSDFKHAAIRTDDFTPEEIQNIVYNLNLELNFVHNSDIRLGDYAKALIGFENAIRVKPDHALGYYYGSYCAKMLGLEPKAKEYEDKFKAILTTSDFWRGIVQHFNILESANEV